MTSDETISVLFVCLGNICRSPLAEGVFAQIASEAGLDQRFTIDSAGTGAYHAGEAPDSRSVAVAERHDVHLAGLARQVTVQDLERFDWIVAMDSSNRRSMEDIRPATGSGRIVLMRDFDPEESGGDVPDPYYGGEDGFEQVYQILDRSCRELLDALLA